MITMNPLRPSPRLLRRIASEIQTSTNCKIMVWVEAMKALPRPRRSNLFHETSVVRVVRENGLCGYEVWRHLEKAKVDPTRKKARLFFGRRSCGGIKKALQHAYKAAAMLSRMSRRELREWWEEYQVARTHGRSVNNLWRDEVRYVDGVGYEDLEQMSHTFTRR